jgi:hypothetical protein
MADDEDSEEVDERSSRANHDEICFQALRPGMCCIAAGNGRVGIRINTVQTDLLPANEAENEGHSSRERMW